MLPGRVTVGVFDDLDAAIAWHPSDKTQVSLGSAKAMVSVHYTFAGVAAHDATLTANAWPQGGPSIEIHFPLIPFAMPR